MTVKLTVRGPKSGRPQPVRKMSADGVEASRLVMRGD